MRSGYRWYELKVSRRRWITWQIPFTRSYSIAWSQGIIDQDRDEEIATKISDFRAGLIADIDLSRTRKMTKQDEFFDSG
jgi:hypothetical protein